MRGVRNTCFATTGSRATKASSAATSASLNSDKDAKGGSLPAERDDSRLVAAGVGAALGAALLLFAVALGAGPDRLTVPGWPM